MIDDSKESINSKSQVRYGKTILILSILCMDSFYCGYCLAYLTALGPTTIQIYGSNAKPVITRALLSAFLALGVGVGIYMSKFVIPLTSKKKLTLFLSLLAIVLQLIIQIQYLFIFFIFRFFQGIIVGNLMELISIYSKQLMPSQINKKGIFGIFSNVFVIIGVFMTYLINVILVQAQVTDLIRWRLTISLNIIGILILIICIFAKIIPESPIDLIKKGQIIKAKQIISIFHKKDKIQNIYKNLVQQVQTDKRRSTIKKVLIIKNQNKKSKLNNFLTYEIPIMQQFTGIPTYYTQMGAITNSYHIPFGLYFPLILGAVQVIAALLSIFYLHKVQRRKMVLCGNFILGICDIGMGIVFLFIDVNPQSFWFFVTLMILFIIANGFTLIPSIWIYIEEIGQQNHKRNSQAIYWFVGCLAQFITPIINAQFGYSPMFFTFGTITLIFFIVNFLFMTQTLKWKTKKKKSHLQIQCQSMTNRNSTMLVNKK